MRGKMHPCPSPRTRVVTLAMRLLPSPGRIKFSPFRHALRQTRRMNSELRSSKEHGACNAKTQRTRKHAQSGASQETREKPSTSRQASGALSIQGRKPRR